MPINVDAVGTLHEPFEVTWTSSDALLYAIGVGASTAELAFTTENTHGTPQLVLPTFPVVLAFHGSDGFEALGPIDRTMLVHGQHAITLHRGISVAGAATLQGRIAAIYDKGSGALVLNEVHATQDGEPLYTTMSSVFIRGAGGWGGDRGPSGPQHVPPEGAPDDQVTYTTSPDQALLYRLSGDRNPLHTDPAFAALGGFDRPILHGLCTYGFTGRALLHTACGSDPSRFEHLEGRFVSPVLPGETLTVSMWHIDDTTTLFTTAVGDRLVIDQGLLRHH